MEKLVASFFEKEKIEYFKSAEIADEYICLSRKLPSFAKYVTVFLIPYKTEVKERNVSFYAVPRDYHFYIKELGERLKNELSKNGISESFEFFSDNSPFFERKLALDLGLGCIGKNGLVINEKYGSYVFIAELVTEKKLSLSGRENRLASCIGCSACLRACPSKCLFESESSECMSQITQKKKLSAVQEKLLKGHSFVWGCDICQEVCPHNRNASDTPIGFFKENLLPFVTKETLLKMDDAEFSKRAYAWRGRNVILRNIELSDTGICSAKFPYTAIITETKEKINKEG